MEIVRYPDTVPAVKGQTHSILKGAGHSRLDDMAEKSSQVVVEFIQANPE